MNALFGANTCSNNASRFAPNSRTVLIHFEPLQRTRKLSMTFCAPSGKRQASQVHAV
jgi:hypothetical protein